MDEYQILRQLDNKLPDDDTPNLVSDSNVGYLPETSLPPRVAHRDYTGPLCPADSWIRHPGHLRFRSL